MNSFPIRLGISDMQVSVEAQAGYKTALQGAIWVILWGACWSRYHKYNGPMDKMGNIFGTNKKPTMELYVPITCNRKEGHAKEIYRDANYRIHHKACQKDDCLGWCNKKSFF
jgi:hypothetical protein